MNYQMACFRMACFEGNRDSTVEDLIVINAFKDLMFFHTVWDRMDMCTMEALTGINTVMDFMIMKTAETLLLISSVEALMALNTVQALMAIPDEAFGELVNGCASPMTLQVGGSVYRYSVSDLFPHQLSV